MKIRISKVLYSFIIVLFIGIIPTASNAATSGGIDSFLVEMDNGTIVNVEFLKFAQLVSSKNDAYKLLAGDDDSMVIHGFSSGKKYIEFLVFAMALSNQNYNLANALETAKPLSETDVATFHTLINRNGIYSTELDYRINELEIGLFPGDINSNNIYFEIPNSDLRKSINNINIQFSYPVRLYLSDESNFSQRISDKLRSSGYNPDSYYSEFNINFSDTWKYSHIVDSMDSKGTAQISFINQAGLVKDYKIHVAISK